MLITWIFFFSSYTLNFRHKNLKLYSHTFRKSTFLKDFSPQCLHYFIYRWLFYHFGNKYSNLISNFFNSVECKYERVWLQGIPNSSHHLNLLGIGITLQNSWTFKLLHLVRSHQLSRQQHRKHHCRCENHQVSFLKLFYQFNKMKERKTYFVFH